MTGQSGRENNLSFLSVSSVTVVLVDSSVNLETLKKFAVGKSIKFITMDYTSHKILSENGIVHEISDNYLNDSDLKMIQKNSYTLSKWFENPQIKQYVEYDGINLGQLFYAEFHYLLVPLLKKFVELTKIIPEHEDAKFVTPPALYNVAKSLAKTVESLEISTFKPNESLHDSVKIHLKTGKTSITLKISQKSYAKLKNLSEKIIHLLLNPRQIVNNNKKILFVEFDTIKYDRMFSIMPQFPLNPLFYGRRRPAIWNYRSFSTMKKSNCIVITESIISDSVIKTSIRNGQRVMTEKIDDLLNNSFFRQFFSIGEISFWDLLNVPLTQLCKNRLEQAVEEIEFAKKLFEKYMPTSVSVWSESGFNEQIVINIARRSNIPIILLQHGLYYDTQEAYEFNKFSGIFPINSHKLVVWGEILKQYAISSGIPGDKIEVIGSPMHDDLFLQKKKNSNPSNGFVLLATSSPVNHLVNDLMVKTNERYEESIRKICQVVSKMNKKLVIKLHPSPVEFDITKVAKDVNHDIIVVKSGSIFPLISECELLIMTDISTAIVESQILKKPVISVSIKDYGFGDPTVFKNNSCVQTSLDDFEMVFKKMLSDIEFRKQIIERGSKYIQSYFVNGGKASERLLSFLEKLE